ncbi:MAG: protein kinase [Pirellulales bacterium]|nr:protein kinase [Pirellulales bacterium]
MLDNDPTAESILRTLAEDAANSGLSCPSLATLRVAIEHMRSAGQPSEANECQLVESSFGRYRLERALGEGGFGWVFLAIDPTLNRHVALKIPRPKFAAIRRIQRIWLAEAEAAARLDHPQIVPVYEAGEIESLVYIASAYCPGPTLAEWLDSQGGAVSAKVAARIMAPLADAVAHAHQCGILHRDIKPANVLCQETRSHDSDEPGINPRLTDFGLARSLTEDLSDMSVVEPVGTPRYMAPEQAAGQERDVGVGTDVYALGAVLFQLLAGEPPFADANVRDTLWRIQNEDASSTKLQARRVPLDLQAICLKCLAKQPAERYRSALELRDDLTRFLDARPVRARPLDPVKTLARWCARRPALASSLAVAFLAVLLGSMTAVWQARKANQLAWQSLQHELVAAGQASHARQQLLDSHHALMELGWVSMLSTAANSESSRMTGRHVRSLLNEFYKHSVERGLASQDVAVHAGALCIRGLQAVQLAEYKDASRFLEASIAEWRHAIREFPEQPQYRHSLAMALFFYTCLLDQQDVSASNSDSVAQGNATVAQALASAECDASVRDTYAAMMSELGSRFILEGNTRDANVAFERSLAELAKSCAATPDNPAHHLAIGQIKRFQAEIALRNHRHEQTSVKLAESVTSLDRALALDSSNLWIRENLGATYVLFGQLHQDQRSQEAVSYFERAVAEFEFVIARAGPRADLSQSLVSATAELTRLYQENGDFKRALACYERRVELQASLERQGSLNPPHMIEYAFTCYDYAELAVRRKRTDLAQQQYAKAQELFSQLHRRRKLSANGLAAWAQCLVFAGDQAALADRDAEAAEHYRQALERLDHSLERRPDHEPVLQRRRAVETRLTRLAQSASAPQE